MLQDFLQEQRIAGYPPFACRADDGQGVVWWAPVRSGEPMIDYPAGIEHFRSTLGLVQALRRPDFYRHVIVPELTPFPPHGVLACIVNSMTVVGPMERGFLDALTLQAAAGRLPPLSEDGTWLEGDQLAERHAHNCIEFARSFQLPEFVTDELAAAIDGRFFSGTPRGFIWTVCRAAASGALN